MPTLSQLGLGLSDRTVGNIGSAAGVFPQPAVFNTIARLGQPRGDPLAPYIGALGPRSVIGPARGSPAGLPAQAQEASPFALTRERIQRELEDNPALQRKFDANTTAEVGTDPDARRKYQAATIDRAVQTGAPLAEVITARDYYPPRTLAASQSSGYQVDPAIFEGANPANYATGNASWDPVKQKWVGFAGGPQTSTAGAGRGMELYGIEGSPGLEYARIMGYTGPSRTAIGPGGPQGTADTTPLGWESTVGASPTGVGYVNPAIVAQGATTDPRLLVRPSQGFSWASLLGGLSFMPPKPVAAPPPFTFGSRYEYRPIGGRRGQ